MKNISSNGIVKVVLALSCFVLAASIFVFSLKSLSSAHAGTDSPEKYQVSSPIGEYQFTTFSLGGVTNILVWKSSNARSRLYYFDGKNKNWRSWLDNEQIPQIPLK